MSERIVMFRIVTITAFGLMCLGIGVHCVYVFLREPQGWRYVLHVIGGVVYRSIRVLSPKDSGFLSSLRGSVFLLASLSLVGLAGSGFIPVLGLNPSLSGYLLILHLMFAPVFLVSVALLALMCTPYHSFVENGGRSLHLIQQEGGTRARLICAESDVCRRICFWLIIVFTLPLGLSIVLGMSPFIGSLAQTYLLEIHRYCALTISLAAVMYIYLISASEAKRVSRDCVSRDKD